MNDPEAYPSFMPFTKECRILQRTKDYVVAYQRLDLPLVADRDYTLRSRHSKRAGPGGPIYRIDWHPANNIGPAKKAGVQRVTVCTGSWMLEPSGPGETLATYRIYTDSGGSIPAFIANSGSRKAIRMLFDAIRKEVLLPKYMGAAR